MKLKAWINAARLRTLPLSVSGIIVGYGLASMYGYTDVLIFIIALATTICFQITSNFANDYGDGVKGTDNDERIGPERAYQSGALSRKELKRGILISIIVSIIFVVVLVLKSFVSGNIVNVIVFLVLGIISIWAAIKYTVGKSAYGYRGLGDIFVFTFFGIVGVLGSMFLITKVFFLEAILPASTVGLLSVAVLNLNNLRDIESDRKSNKNTLVVKMGFTNGKTYHYLLLLFSFICTFIFTIYNYWVIYNFIWLLSYIPILIHLRRTIKMKNSVTMDPELKVVALSTFLFAVLFYFSFNIFL